MGRFDTTKATINANIKSNGNQEITGSVLNSVLQEIVDGTAAQLTELSAHFGAELSYGGAAYTEFPCSLGKGMIMTDMGVATAVYLKTRTGNTIDVYYNQLPYVINEEITSFMVNTASEGIVTIQGEFNELEKELSELSVHFGESEIPYGGAAYTDFPCSLSKGMTIISMGVTSAVYLKTKAGQTIDVYAVPFTIEEDVIAFAVNTTSQGVLTIKGDVDRLNSIIPTIENKIDRFNDAIPTIEEDIAQIDNDIAIIRQDIGKLSEVSFSYGGAAYTDFPCRLYKGMTLTDMGVSSAVYLKTKSGSTIDVYYNQLPYAIDEEITSFMVNTENEGEIVAMGEDAILIKELDDSVNGLMSAIKIKAKYSLGKILVATAWDEDNDLIREIDYNNQSANKNVNLYLAYISKKDKFSQDTLIKSCGDDICPAFINGSYIAGNHGWNVAKNIVVASHDKTIADIGSVYIDDAGIKFTLMDIKDATTLVFCSENTSTEAHNYRFLDPVGKLTYVSNGKNTSAINPISYSNLGNLYGCVTPSTKKFFVDDKPIMEEGIYYGETVTLVESYDVIDMPSILSAITSNRPSGGYAIRPTYYELSGAKRLFNVTNAYKFDGNGVTLVNSTIRAYMPLSFGFFGVTQALNAEGNLKLYCPKTLPIQVGGTRYDLRTLANWNSAPSSDILITPTYWENAESAPDRAVMLNDIATFSCGYILDRGKLSEPRKELVNRYAMHFSVTRKLYPMGICTNEPILMQSGDYYSAVAYRAYGNRAKNPSQRTHYSVVPIDSATYLYADYHGTIEDYLPINPQWVGKKITIVEKNDKCNVYEDVVTGEIRVDSTASSSEYGYIVLRIE